MNSANGGLKIHDINTSASNKATKTNKDKTRLAIKQRVK
jgi:hypothetical protein